MTTATQPPATRPLATPPLAAPPGEGATAEQVLEWGVASFGNRLGICTSFQASGMVIIDIAARITKGKIRVFTIDTGRLPEETFDLISRVRRRYGIAIEVVLPDPFEIGKMVSTHGPNLFRESVAKRRMCCELRKVRPLKRKLSEFDAWVTGVRQGQSETRRQVPLVEPDPLHQGVFKLCPLALWSDQQVWDYIREHDVPYHELYGRGYTSIGCAPCSRPALEGEHSRAGRWWWEGDAQKECGLHASPSGELRREFDVLLEDLLGRPA